MRSDDETVRDLFMQAVELPAADQQAFLDRSGAETSTKQKVLDLLKLQRSAGAFLGRPATEAYAMLAGQIGERIDEFQIGKELGRGGMGIVYEAFDTELRRPVALKVLTPRLDGNPAAIARFRREGQAVAQLHHQNIVQVYRSGQQDGLSYIAMELVDGHTFRQHLLNIKGGSASSPRNREVQLREIARLLAPIADALEHAHQHKVLHRDVKPSNILVDKSGTPKLTDFGVAQMPSDEVLTVAGDVAGSYGYMSPEQARVLSIDIDHRTDIFSLGVVLYEALCGSRPFPGETPQEVIRSLTKGSAPPLPCHTNLIPRDLATICHKALEIEPKARYQRAAHLAADLRCWLSGDPILARPPGLLERAGRHLRRHRHKVVAVALVVLFVCTMLLLLWREGNRGTALLSVATRPHSTVYVRKMDAVTTLLGPWQNLGTTGSFRLPLGTYRVAALVDDGTFVESSVTLADDTWRAEIRLNSTEPPDVGDMVHIPAGSFRFAETDMGPLTASTTVTIPAFLIDRCEVSNEQYHEFTVKTGYPIPSTWRTNGYDPSLANRPIVAITWEDAVAYAAWRGKRLPTAWEWEYAMGLPDGRSTPWGVVGSEPLGGPNAEVMTELASANTLEKLYGLYVKRSQPVDGAPLLATPLGIQHAATNASEWTETVYLRGSPQVAIRGGSWEMPYQLIRLDSKRTQPFFRTGSSTQLSASVRLGFRCVRSLAINTGDSNAATTTDQSHASP